MNRWQRSVDELQVRRRQVMECERAQEALGKVTACFQQLATSVGSNSDGSFLREEMDETRALAHRIITGLHRRLVSLLTEMDPGQEDREQVERLWVLFLSGLENLQQDLQKTSALYKRFRLTQRNDRRALVNTGVSDSVAGVAARAASVQTPWISIDLEQSPTPDLQTHIDQVDLMVREMLQKVSVPFWAVEATQEAWVEVTEGAKVECHDRDDTLEEMMEVELVSQDSKTSGCCHPSNCKLGCMFCLLN